MRSSRSEDEIVNALIRTAGLGAVTKYIQSNSGGVDRKEKKERRWKASYNVCLQVASVTA